MHMCLFTCVHCSLHEVCVYYVLMRCPDKNSATLGADEGSFDLIWTESSNMQGSL